jgi:uncharacterized protein
MKIAIAGIPPEGLAVSEDIPAEKLDLDTEIIKFRGVIRVTGEIFKITNALTVELDIQASMFCLCSRCAEEFIVPLDKHLQSSCSVDRTIPVIDLGPDIREEIILGYPVKFLCRPDCLGLCIKCGGNRNLGQCSCSDFNNSKK